ncbi:conserved hypothetical protein [Gammaproteobacteria bacterium]
MDFFIIVKRKYSIFEHRGKIAAAMLFHLAGVCLVTLLVACTSTGYVPSSSRSAENYAQKAEEYSRLAKTASGKTKSGYLLSAAENWLRAGRPDAAEQALNAATFASPDFSSIIETRLLMAQLARVRNHPAKVLTALEGLPQPTTATALRIQIAELRAWALLTRNQGVGAARVLSEIAPLLVEPEKVRANRKALWEALRTVVDADLAALSASGDPILGPWAELAQIQRASQGKNPNDLTAAVQAWRLRHKTHPITEELINELLSRPPRSFSSSPSVVPPTLKMLVSHVALVLPSDGPAARAAAAVRDGFLAAWYAVYPRDRPTVTFHPFSGGAVKAAYQSAVAAGAGLIIGPLTKEEVQTLIQGKDDLPCPTLAMNYLSENAAVPARLYQFGLAPADEARQAAQQAWLDGYTRAFVVTSGNDWGDRVRQAFRIRWEGIGGTVVRLIAAETKPEDLLATLLKARSESLASGANPPSKGGDFVFLAAPAESALRLSPVLRQARLPVYATSHVLAGTEQDRKLPDARIIDIPWIISPDAMAARLRADLERLWPKDYVTYRRIYALGVDAFQLMGELTRLESDASARFLGVTGSLALDGKRRVVRQGVWTRIKDGQIISDNHILPD